MFCGNCGAEFKSGDKFCQNCGEKLVIANSKSPNIDDIKNLSEIPEAIPSDIHSSDGKVSLNNEKTKLYLDGSYHPWRRFFARTIDLFTLGLLIFLIVAFLIGYLFPSLSNDVSKLLSNEIIAGLVLYLLWLPAEAAFISLAGTTPGKWLFGIRVFKVNGALLSYSDALERSALVWFKGDGLGIPIVAMFARAIAYDKLKKTGTTSWDKTVGSVVYGGPIRQDRIQSSLSWSVRPTRSCMTLPHSC